MEKNSKLFLKKKAGLKSKLTLIIMLDLSNKINIIKILNHNLKYIDQNQESLER